VIAIAQGLGLEVGAAGVERAEQLAALAALECDTYQGDYACTPMPAEALTARLAGRLNEAR
jgi:EAL domain-containing protein (putative c-di-GMP-specific phosphodiesterase class I)